MTKTWTQCYEEAQAQQFVFENQLSIAIGTPDWHANHTLHHAMLESKSAKQQTKLVCINIGAQTMCIILMKMALTLMRHL